MISLFNIRQLLLVILLSFCTSDSSSRQIVSEPIFDVEVVSDNENLEAYAVTSNQIILLRVDQFGKPQIIKKIPVAGPQHVTISGSKLAYSSKEDKIYIFDLDLNPQFPSQNLARPKREVADLYFSGNHLNVGLVDGTVLIYDSKQHKPIYTIGSNNSHVDQICFHLLSQKYLIYRSGELSLWNFVERKQLWYADLPLQSVQSVQFDQEGRLAVVQSNNKILIYNTQASTNSVASQQPIYTCEASNDSFLAFCFGPANTLLTIEKSGQVKQWDILKQTHRNIQRLEPRTYTAITCFSTNLEKYWVSTNQGEIVSHSLNSRSSKNIEKKPPNPVEKRITKLQLKPPKVSKKTTGKDTLRPAKTSQLVVELSPAPPDKITVGESLRVEFSTSREAVILARKIPENAIFSNERWLSWKPTLNQVGRFDFQFYAITNDNQSKSINFVVKVDANSPPRFLYIDERSVDTIPLVFETEVGENLTLIIIAEDPELDSLSLSVLPPVVGVTIEQTGSPIDFQLQEDNWSWKLIFNSNSTQPQKFDLKLTDGLSVVLLPIEIQVKRSFSETNVINLIPPTTKDIPDSSIKQTIGEKQNTETPLMTVPPGMVKIVSGHQRDFFIDQYEVTNLDFVEFLNQTDLLVSDLINLAATYVKIEKVDDRFRVKEEPPAENLPVVGVSWVGACAFAKWKNKILPTAEQWEIAAQRQLFPWSEGPLTNADWEMTGPIEVGTQGSDVTPSSVFDLASNVAEWTLSEQAGKQIIKGGSWRSRQLESLKPFRLALAPNQTLSWVGFRCILVIK